MPVHVWPSVPPPTLRGEAVPLTAVPSIEGIRPF